MLPICVIAQKVSVSGKVSAKQSKGAIPSASVFLSNSSFGTITGADGTYRLNNLRPGQYTLVVTAVGFAEHTQKINVGDVDLNINIELEPKTIQLREVVISTNAKADWKRNFEQFKKDFIGSDANAKLCQILNPDVLYLTYSKKRLTLEGESDKFLVIDNRGLGYRVKFLLKNFKSDGIAQVITYGGERVFEDMPGSAAQKKKWDAARDRAYYGSAMHFYRSLYKDKLKEEGFEARQLTRYPNPARPEDHIIRQKIEKFRALGRPDSANYWIEVANSSKYVNERLSQIPWYSFEILKATTDPGIYALTFPHYLYVMYLPKRDENNYKDIFRPLDIPNYETSVITLFNKPQVAFFDKNGIVINGEPLYEGAWSQSRLSELLPVDYVPTQSLESAQHN